MLVIFQSIALLTSNTSYNAYGILTFLSSMKIRSSGIPSFMNSFFNRIKQLIFLRISLPETIGSRSKMNMIPFEQFLFWKIDSSHGPLIRSAILSVRIKNLMLSYGMKWSTLLNSWLFALIKQKAKMQNKEKRLIFIIDTGNNKDRHCTCSWTE